jgi:hypothetical protein
MEANEVYSPSVRIRVIYLDLPDLIEVETFVKSKDWCGRATAYTSPIQLAKEARTLASWSLNPTNEFSLQIATNAAVGVVILRFYVHDKAGHLRCQISLAERDIGQHPEDVPRLTYTMPTEPGLVERFARQLESFTEIDCEAALQGLASYN